MKPGFLRAAAYPFYGLTHLLRSPRLWKFAALPFAVNLVVYTLLAGLLFWFVGAKVMDWISSWPAWLRWLMAVVAFLSGLVILAFTFTIVGNILASPFLDLLAERALADLRGRPLAEGGRWHAEAAASVGRQLAKLAIFGAVQLVLLLLLLIPVVGVLHPVVAALVTVFFLALEYLEYPQSADRMPFGERFRYLTRHLRESLGFGGALFVIVLIPFVGYLALPACVLGAVLLYRDLEQP